MLIIHSNCHVQSECRPDLQKTLVQPLIQFVFPFLRVLGFDGAALDRFTSYLTNRKQVVTLSGHPNPSSTSAVTQGVPQGSVLGSLVFIVYILSLGQILHHFKLDFYCYTDDLPLVLNPLKGPPLTHLETASQRLRGHIY